MPEHAVPGPVRPASLRHRAPPTACADPAERAVLLAQTRQLTCGDAIPADLRREPSEIEQRAAGRGCAGLRDSATAAQNAHRR
ncbi:hypothetical protein [Streptomyces chartreusis]|uniref:hypothetical protein n=1 Tax=Streptomyces chartreusis TaxID=1969 RepID=UPI00343C94F4